MKKFKILTCLVLVVFSVLAFASCDMTIGHTYGEDYLYDADGHWHECTSEKCDAVTRAEPHKFEVVGDENVCVCGYKQTVATVNDAAFTSLAAAVAAAEAGDIVYVVADVQLDAKLVIEAPITLNGNGKTITTTVENDDIILVTSDNVTLKNIVVDGKISETAEAVKGVQFYNVNDCAIADVTVKNVTKVGLLINAADVTATGTITLENTGWSDAMQINVGYGTDATNDACVFDFSAATLVGVTEVYADAGDNTRATANGVTITITAAEGWAVNAEAAEGVTSYKPAQA